MSAKQCRDLCSILGLQRIQRITGGAFRISFQSDWQIDNGFWNRPANPGTQLGGAQQRFRSCFADGLNQSLVSSVARANGLRERDKCDIFPIAVGVVP